MANQVRLSPRHSAHALVLDIMPAEEIARRAARRAALVRVRQAERTSLQRLAVAFAGPK